MNKNKSKKNQQTKKSNKKKIITKVTYEDGDVEWYSNGKLFLTLMSRDEYMESTMKID